MNWYTQFTHFFGNWLTNLENLLTFVLATFAAWFLNLACVIFYPLATTFINALPSDTSIGMVVTGLNAFSGYLATLDQFMPLGFMFGALVALTVPWVVAIIFNFAIKLIPGT